MISPLLTDLYQLTMAYGYWQSGLHEREAVFQQIFRNNPFKGHYAVACGLETVIEFLQAYRFSEEDIHYLASLRLFPAAFLDYLRHLRFTCDVDAIPEGTLVFAHEPLLRIKGPLLQGQLLESTLLNIVNFQTLIATKAARVCQAAGNDPVLEFGLRRAQGPDGALSASRAAYIGGCTATSNVLAGKKWGIPLRGTHAHSWVTAFPDELTAFATYAEAMPENCVFLVDTYHTIPGVHHAIDIGKRLRAKGVALQGIRLDSGDMATLSREARQLLDAAGFHETKIVASNSLDEYVIADMKQKGAAISIWGVGTNLVTAYDCPALDGVYKLSALRNAQGEWEYKLKLSEQPSKISNPGIYQVRRFMQGYTPVMDMMYDVELGISDHPAFIALDHSEKAMPAYQSWTDCQLPIFRQGQLVYEKESIHAMRERSRREVNHFPNKPYPVGLEKNLHRLTQDLIEKVSSQQ